MTPSLVAVQGLGGGTLGVATQGLASDNLAAVAVVGIVQSDNQVALGAIQTLASVCGVSQESNGVEVVVGTLASLGTLVLQEDCVVRVAGFCGVEGIVVSVPQSDNTVQATSLCTAALIVEVVVVSRRPRTWTVHGAGRDWTADGCGRLWLADTELREWVCTRSPAVGRLWGSRFFGVI